MPPKSRAKHSRVKSPVKILRCSETELMNNTRGAKRPPWFIDRKLQRVLVYNRVYDETSTGLKANQLEVNGRGKIVSAAKSYNAYQRFYDTKKGFGVEEKEPSQRWKYVRNPKKHPGKRAAPTNYAYHAEKDIF